MSGDSAAYLPPFLQRQYSLEVLAGLCGFQQKEKQVCPEGIGQDLYRSWHGRSSR